MSVGNLKDYGNKGNNFPYQLAVLKLLDSILTAVGALPGIDYELRTTNYKANKAGAGYSNGDFISRVDIINASTGAIVSTLWFNETTGLTIAAPPIADLNPYIPPSSVTVSNLPAALGQATMANSLAVVIASNQSAIPITVAALPLPTGAATEATLATLLTLAGFQARINTLGQKTMANSTPVVLSSDQSAIPVTSTSSSTARTPTLVRDTAAGTVLAGARSVSVYNAGTTNGVWLGATIKPGEQFSYSAPMNDTLGAFAYTASATAELVITTIV